MADHSPPRILLLAPRLGGGGAQRVVEVLARRLPAGSYDLHLALMAGFSAGRTPESYAFPAHLCLYAFREKRVRAAAWKLLRLIRRLRPDLIFSSIYHLNFLILLLRPLLPSSTRIVVRQNGTVSSALAALRHPACTAFLYRWLYPRACRIVCQSQAMAEDLARQINVQTDRLTVLPNPLETPNLPAPPASVLERWDTPGPRLLAVGRLAPEKGYDLLLQALSAVRLRFPTVSLALAGAGEEECTLRLLTRRLGLEHCVRFLGAVEEPSAFFAAADLFVLSSRHEGLPNALLEAAAAGLPLVSTPASGGIVDLLSGQPGCWISEDISAPALAAALQTALHALPPGQRFPHPFVEEFRIERALPLWNAFFASVLYQKR
jgi:glycosyltransferase involved in cell wall biosynthesis